ncbi:LysE family translocator [Pararhizobium sp. PWRC1-1]|uniref:LysE family translocator n=1 Tax=Pararhizobium sp. PWRC1-1 TaxID=2804566 RepID=UPI003CF8246E
MTTALLLSMATFSLAASISPGPVNIVAMSTGMRHGLGRSMRFTGASVGFAVLLILIGLGLSAAVNWLPNLLASIRWAGVLFLAYMAIALAADGGGLSANTRPAAPSAIDGALLQWLNPKPWLASTAGMGVFAAGTDLPRLLIFAAIYFVVCYVSVSCWAMAGMALRQWVTNSSRIRIMNRFLAALVAATAAYLALASA